MKDEKKDLTNQNNERSITYNNSIIEDILDYSLISSTQLELYGVKVVRAGEYVELYTYPIRKSKIDETLEPITFQELKNKFLDFEERLYKNSKTKSRAGEVGVIEYKNLLRSRLNMVRLAKANIHCWRTFVTLTFAENLTDVIKANKCFKSFITQMKRYKKDFKYLCVPEFQKRGAVHYHLITNLEYDDPLFSSEEKQIWNPSDGRFQIFKILTKYWPHGFTNVENFKTIDAVLYLAKYIVKDYDNRLFCHRRYLYSQNLEKHFEEYLDLSNPEHLEHYKKIVADKTCGFQSQYFNIQSDVVLYASLEPQCLDDNSSMLT